MTDAQYRQALALFRYGLIAEFIQLPAGSRGLYARLAARRERADAQLEMDRTGKVLSVVGFGEGMHSEANATTAVA